MPRKIEVRSVLSLNANISSLWQGGLLFNWQGGGRGRLRKKERTSSRVFVSYTTSSLKMVGYHNKYFNNKWEITSHSLVNELWIKNNQSCGITL